MTALHAGLWLAFIKVSATSKFLRTLAGALLTLSVATQAQLLGPSNIDKVKESVLVLDQTRTLVQALELSDCFTETKWSSFTDDKGRDIVQFEGRFKDFSHVAKRIRPTLGRMAPDKEYTTFTCGPCTYFIQFAMLKSQTAIPGLGIQGQSFTILRSWFEAEVTKTAGGITYNPERIRAPEQGNDFDEIAAGMLGLGGTGLISPTLQQIYAGSFPNVIATVFTSISAALNKPYNSDYFSVISQEQYEKITLEQKERERQTNIAKEKAKVEAYREVVIDALKASWNSYIRDRMDLCTLGAMSVVVNIDRSGKVKNPRVLSNTSNEAFETITIESMLAAKVPPIPLDVVAVLNGEELQIESTFSLVVVDQ